MGLLVARPTPADIQRYTEATNARLMELAQIHAISEPVIRDILPGTDLNALSGEVWRQDLSAFAYNVQYSGTMATEKAIVIFGARPLGQVPHQRTALIRFLKGTTGAQITDIWDVAMVASDEHPLALAEPESLIEYVPSGGFNIEFYGDSSGLDNIALLGKVVEPKGKTISPKPSG